MAALSIGEYPPDLAMYFILNGCSSYFTSFDGIALWYKAFEEIRRGREYVSLEVIKRIDMRRDYPDPAGNITDRQKQIILLMCNGFRDEEIGELLNITSRTVTTQKTQIFTSLNVRGPNELIRTALYLEIVKQDGLYFYPTNYTLNPLPEEKIYKRMRNEK
jgi:DNA-binding NarL/FixJ family response regulator